MFLFPNRDATLDLIHDPVACFECRFPMGCLHLDANCDFADLKVAGAVDASTPQNIEPSKSVLKDFAACFGRHFVERFVLEGYNLLPVVLATYASFKHD